MKAKNSSGKVKDAAQSARTARNKVKKYQKLIAERPNDKHRTFWENEIKFNT